MPEFLCAQTGPDTFRVTLMEPTRTYEVTAPAALRKGIAVGVPGAHVVESAIEFLLELEDADEWPPAFELGPQLGRHTPWVDELRGRIV